MSFIIAFDLQKKSSLFFQCSILYTAIKYTVISIIPLVRMKAAATVSCEV